MPDFYGADTGRTPGRAAFALVSTFLGATLLTTACSPAPDPTPTRTATPTLTADEAWEKYGELATELKETLPSAYPELDWTIHEPRVGGASDGKTCSLVLGDVTSPGFIPLSEPEYLPRTESGVYDDFAAARTALDPILERHGFSALGDIESNKAGMQSIYSRSPEGLTFRLSTRNYTDAKLPSVPLDPATCIPGDYTPPGSTPAPSPAATDD